MKRVYCLYRVSTKGQVDKDDIPMQKTSCREFAERNGWTILKEFQEKGVSGFKVSASDRDAIQDLKTAAEKKEFDVLLVFMFDRIGRIDDETPFVVEWFIKHGIEVWSVNEGEQRMDNHVDKLMNYIRFWQANGESQKTSARVKTRLNQMTLDGKFTGGVAPFGYKLIKSGEINKKGKELMDIVIDDDEAPIVKKIFEMTVKEGYGSYRMADYLNSHGIKTHNNSKFQCNTVNRILKNRLYCGYLVSGGVESPYIERLHIIDENIFDQAQFILKQRSSKNEEKQQIARTTKGSTLLSGNIYCAHCGQKMVSTSYIDQILYTQESNELLLQARDFRSEIEALNNTVAGDTTKVYETERLINYCKRGEMLTDFNKSLFELFVDHILIYSRQKIGFVLRCGLTFEEMI
ncbi:recombinase family protein [Ruminococcus sp.]|uniref:recombinase family protein n=1 Tax=Ruminococcus sp. TaxID=41978 RepID=UPI0035220EFA